MKKDLALRNHYNISLEDFEALAEKQNHACAICQLTLDMAFHTHVDHCHATENIRGLLCSRCNLAIGYFGDNTAVMERAIDYINRQGGSNV